MPEIHVTPRPRRVLPRRLLVAGIALLAAGLGATGAYLLPSGSAPITHAVPLGAGAAVTPASATAPPDPVTPVVVPDDGLLLPSRTDTATGTAAVGASPAGTATVDPGAGTPAGHDSATGSASAPPAAPHPPAGASRPPNSHRPHHPAPDVAGPVYAVTRQVLSVVDHRAPQVRPATDVVRSVLHAAAPATTRVTGLLTGIVRPVVRPPIPAAGSHR